MPCSTTPSFSRYIPILAQYSAFYAATPEKTITIRYNDWDTLTRRPVTIERSVTLKTQASLDNLLAAFDSPAWLLSGNECVLNIRMFNMVTILGCVVQEGLSTFPAYSCAAILLVSILLNF
jgi:hypothetical protein